MQRVAFVMRVKKGEEDEYIRRHQDVWPEVLADMQRAGVQRMSIFMNGRELFVYMEAKDYAKAAHLLAESPDSVHWEKSMATIVEDASGDAYDPNNPYPEGLPEVFFWEAENDRS